MAHQKIFKKKRIFHSSSIFKLFFSEKRHFKMYVGFETNNKNVNLIFWLFVCEQMHLIDYCFVKKMIIEFVSCMEELDLKLG